MEAAQIVALPVAPRVRPSVHVEGETVLVDRLRVTDRSLAAFVEQRTEDERGDLAERALRIGLLAIQDAGTTLDVEFVRREFDGLLARNETMNARAADALDQMLRQNFGDTDGRLPRTLEKFLGDRGQLNRFVNELFDENKRDSAIGRMRALLGTYFDGDASRLAQLLDPTRLGSPLHQFRSEMTQGFEKLNERLSAMEAAFAARGAERARSAAKGTDFEDLLEGMLTEAVQGTGDAIERTGLNAGDVMRSKKGDFLLTIDPQTCGGADLRVVVEAKDRGLSWRQIREELEAAKQNRTAAVAVAVFTPAHAPSGVAPFDVRFGHVLCVVDPDAPDGATLCAAIRLARLYALATLAEREANVDPARVMAAITAVKSELDAIKAMKTQLTSVGRVAAEVSNSLDRMRDQVLARVSEAEAELRAGMVSTPPLAS